MTGFLDGWSWAGAGRSDLQHIWLRAIETLSASTGAIGARFGLIAKGVRSPQGADLGRASIMIEEKLRALGQGGHSLVTEMGRMQDARWPRAERMGAIMSAGRRITPFEFAASAPHIGDLALCQIDTHARMSRSARAPVHKAATGNARQPGRTPSEHSRS